MAQPFEVLRRRPVPQNPDTEPLIRSGSESEGSDDESYSRPSVRGGNFLDRLSPPYTPMYRNRLQEMAREHLQRRRRPGASALTKCCCLQCAAGVLYLSILGAMLKADTMYIVIPSSAGSKPELGSSVYGAMVMNVVVLAVTSFMWVMGMRCRGFTSEDEL